jgi:hypothetical protein
MSHTVEMVNAIEFYSNDLRRNVKQSHKFAPQLCHLQINTVHCKTCFSPPPLEGFLEPSGMIAVVLDNKNIYFSPRLFIKRQPFTTNLGVINTGRKIHSSRDTYVYDAIK